MSNLRVCADYLGYGHDGNCYECQEQDRCLLHPKPQKEPDMKSLLEAGRDLHEAAKAADNEFLWRQPGTRTLAEKRDEQFGKLRPQQCHVSLARRFWLRCQAHFYSWRWPHEGYADGYVAGFNKISDLYEELALAAAVAVESRGVDVVNGCHRVDIEALEEVLQDHAKLKLGPPARDIRRDIDSMDPARDPFYRGGRL